MYNLASAKLWPENLGTGEPYDADYRLHDYITAYTKTKLGNKSRAGQIEQGIIEYSLVPENWNHGNPLNNYISLALLKKNGKKIRADALINVWTIKQDSIRKWNLGSGSSSLGMRWVLAKYNRQEKKADDLRQKILDNDHFGLNTVFFEAVRISENDED